jgi:hypothetical protein
VLSGAACQSGFPPLVDRAVSYRAYIIPQADPIIFAPFPPLLLEKQRERMCRGQNQTIQSPGSRRNGKTEGTVDLI